MFILLQQLVSGDTLAVNVNNIKEFYPEEISGKGDETLKGTVISLFRGDDWIVSQSVMEVYDACQKSKQGA